MKTTPALMVLLKTKLKCGRAKHCRGCVELRKCKQRLLHMTEEK